MSLLLFTNVRTFLTSQWISHESTKSKTQTEKAYAFDAYYLNYITLTTILKTRSAWNLRQSTAC